LVAVAVVLLALFGAAAIGAGDFLGGHAGRRIGYRQAVVIAYATVAVLALLAAPFQEGQPTTRALYWGVAAGAVALVATEALFSGIGRGRPAVVTPISAVGAAALAALIDLTLLDGDLGWLLAAGLAAGAIAVLLVTRDKSAEGGPLSFSLITGAAAAVGTGLFYVAIDVTATEAGTWLFVPGGLTVAVLGYGLMRLEGRRWNSDGSGWAVVSGTAVAASALAISAAVTRGSLIVVAALVSLYPAVTVLLAGIVWRHRPNRVQWLGLGVAIVAVGLLSQ
jgi:drug/metabolite transporter (DMT)-like permease